MRDSDGCVNDGRRLSGRLLFCGGIRYNGKRVALPDKAGDRQLTIRKVGVVGAGTMGQGISEMLAFKGLDVLLTDQSEQQLDHGLRQIEQSLDKQIEKWALTKAEKKLILARIRPVGSLEEMAECDLVIETITEDLNLKKQVFAELDRVCGPDVILASNTSTLSLTELAGVTRTRSGSSACISFIPLQDGRRGNHPRTENVPTRRSRRTKHFVEDTYSQKGHHGYESPGIRDDPADLSVDQRGAEFAAEGVASAEDIDSAMRVGY